MGKSPLTRERVSANSSMRIVVCPRPHRWRRTCNQYHCTYRSLCAGPRSTRRANPSERPRGEMSNTGRALRRRERGDRACAASCPRCVAPKGWGPAQTEDTEVFLSGDVRDEVFDQHACESSLSPINGTVATEKIKGAKGTVLLLRAALCDTVFLMADSLLRKIPKVDDILKSAEWLRSAKASPGDGKGRVAAGARWAAAGHTRREDRFHSSSWRDCQRCSQARVRADEAGLQRVITGPVLSSTQTSAVRSLLLRPSTPSQTSPLTTRIWNMISCRAGAVIATSIALRSCRD